MDKIKAYMERIDELTIRERGMVLLAVLAVMIFLWDTFLISPLDVRQQSLQAKLESKRAEINALSIQTGQLIRKQQQDPNAALREEFQHLRQELTAVDKSINSVAQELVDPVRMAELLRTVINQTDNLNLIGLNGLGVSPLLANHDKQEKVSSDSSGDTAKSSKEQNIVAAYKHGMQIEFRGGYLQTLEYLRKLEALEWNFFWDRIEFQVENYPDASASIRLYTLSLTSDWIKA